MKARALLQLAVATFLNLTVSLAVGVGFSSDASAQSSMSLFETENILRDRALKVVTKVDEAALVQVHIELKKIFATLPGLGITGQATPLDFGGAIGPDSIQKIQVRIVTSKEVPAWVQEEVKRAVGLGKVKTDIAYEKAGGSLSQPENSMETFIKKDAYELAKQSGNALEQLKEKVYLLIEVVGGALALVALAVFISSRLLQSSFERMIEQKLLPSLLENRQQAAATPRRERERDRSEGEQGFKPQAAPLNPSTSKELSDLPAKVLETLIADCYWTQSDGYAHYIWSQITQEQKEKLIQARAVPPEYFSYLHSVVPENLGYHLDARYLFVGHEFRFVDQTDLLKWLRKNRTSYSRLTPLRIDTLSLSLAERIEFSQYKGEVSASTIEVPSPSQPRKLPVRLEIARLSLEDENYLWKNSASVAAESRSRLRTLVWLAMAPEDYVAGILDGLDARQLAEAWSAPEPVLTRLESFLPEKKREMLHHFLKTIEANRQSDVFDYLVDAGLQAPPAKEAKVAA